MFKSNSSGIGMTRHLLALSCFGILLASGISGCGGSSDTQQEATQEAPLKLQVAQVDQLSKLGDKQADGQFLVVKFILHNNSNQPLNVDPVNFALQFISKDEKQQYTQSFEKNMELDFAKDYGEANQDKLLSWAVDLNPRIDMERYFVFMVPSDASPDQYQLVYTDPNNTASKTTVPLVTTGTTVVNDHRSESPSSAPQPAAEQ